MLASAAAMRLVLKETRRRVPLLHMNPKIPPAYELLLLITAATHSICIDLRERLLLQQWAETSEEPPAFGLCASTALSKHVIPF